MRLIDNIRREKKATIRELQRLETKLERLEEEESAVLKRIMEDM
jgi:hypothetical protein